MSSSTNIAGKKGKNHQYPTIAQDAEKLGVHPIHLWLCLTGRRRSERLMRRYRELKGEPLVLVEKVGISFPARTEFSFFNTPTAASFEALIPEKCTRQDCVVILDAPAELLFRRAGKQGIEITLSKSIPEKFISEESHP